MVRGIKKQYGSAAIILVFLLIPLFGSVFLVLEGTRYIQKKNRLADAAEAAALAVTIANRGNHTSYEETLAEEYVKFYVRNIKEPPKLDVSFRSGERVVGTVKESYSQYKVDVQTSHQSWFSSLLVPSFKPTELVNNKAVARNYPEVPADQLIDLVLVTDFSGSMDRYWQATQITKLDALK